MLSRFLSFYLPRKILATYRNYKILSYEHGQFKSMSRWACIDKNNLPTPWYTYPAIEYLNQLDFSECSVFEYGSGNSTIYWSNKCKNIVSIENDEKWYRKIKPNVNSNCDYHLMPNRNDYINAIHKYSYNYDIIIIDGSYRYECAIESLKKLNKFGFIILDNSDWEQNTASMLRKSDLIEVDMSGFGPINGYTWTTSFFFSRNVKIKCAYDHQPVNCIGSIIKNSNQVNDNNV
jgi:hypothetical protein